MRILLYFLLILLVGCSSGQNKKTHERVDLDSVPVYTGERSEYENVIPGGP